MHTAQHDQPDLALTRLRRAAGLLTAVVLVVLIGGTIGGVAVQSEHVTHVATSTILELPTYTYDSTIRPMSGWGSA